MVCPVEPVCCMGQRDSGAAGGWRMQMEAEVKLTMMMSRHGGDSVWLGNRWGAGSHKFGEIDKNMHAVPLQALNYGMGASFPILQKILEEDTALLDELRPQITAFNQNFGASATASGT